MGETHSETLHSSPVSTVFSHGHILVFTSAAGQECDANNSVPRCGSVLDLDYGPNGQFPPVPEEVEASVHEKQSQSQTWTGSLW